jgi:GT2 family glycosyltransferase
MISVLLATHNGADTIGRTLEAMSQLEVPQQGWELIVVNNASHDETESLILNNRGNLPLTYLVEPQLGKSNAINTGLGAVRGDFIVMTDDDVLPDRDWLMEWSRVAREWPGISVFSGAVVPKFDAAPPPSYVPAASYGALYGAHVPDREGEAKPAQSSGLIEVSGANLAMRRSAYEQGNRLDEIYLIGSSGLMGEDTDFVNRMAKAGYRIGYTNGPRIRHIIHPHQTTLPWIFRRLRSNGRARFMLANVRGDADLPRSEFPSVWRHLGRLAGSATRMVMALAVGRRHEAFRQLGGVAYAMGAIQQAISIYLSRPAIRMMSKLRCNISLAPFS